ncbi:MAG: hypothetical protein ACK4TA_17050 [Saprospiraceae bacterium]
MHLHSALTALRCDQVSLHQVFAILYLLVEPIRDLSAQMGSSQQHNQVKMAVHVFG